MFLLMGEYVAQLLYWTQNICEPELRRNTRGREDGKGKGEQDALCAIAYPLFPSHGWLATNMCICNGQRSSEISCEKYNNKNPHHEYLSCNSDMNSWKCLLFNKLNTKNKLNKQKCIQRNKYFIMWGNKRRKVLRSERRSRVFLNWPAGPAGWGEGSYREFSAGWVPGEREKRENAISHKSTNRQAEQITYNASNINILQFLSIFPKYIHIYYCTVLEQYCVSESVCVMIWVHYYSGWISTAWYFVPLKPKLA
jgi:hypothetical protein